MYYKGAHKSNPFITDDFLKDNPERELILDGKKHFDADSAGEIYQCSICGRACDMECYVHLEKKGVLTKKFKTPFRKRDVWSFDIEDFKI